MNAELVPAISSGSFSAASVISQHSHYTQTSLSISQGAFAHQRSKYNTSILIDADS